MARTKEEIISEMVDSGLFTDDEIRQAVAGARGPGLAERAASSLSTSPRPMASSAAQMVQRLGKDTMESIPSIPHNFDRIKRIISPLPGQVGVSRTLQDLGETMPPVQELVGDASTKLSESKFGQKYPVPAAAIGTAAYTASNLLPPKLTPSEMAYGIGPEGVGMGVRAMRPAVSAVGRGAGKMLESISGLEYKTPGVLEQAAKDSSLIFNEGKKAAGKAYEQIAKMEAVRPEIGRATSANKTIDEALKALDSGSLTPQEAIIARQAVDKAKNSLTKYAFNELRKTFDAIAKTASSTADKAYSRAVMADALRLPLPVNKGGGTSIAKGVLGSIAGIVPLVSMSPLAQGAAATAAGIAGRQVFGKNIPGIRSALSNAIRNYKRTKNAR